MYAPIPELNSLKKFDDTVDDWYAPGFELREFGASDGGYPGAEDRLREFARATSSGSAYAVWLSDDRTDLSTLPVVFLADEGGINLVARNVQEFLQVLASGWVPWGDWAGVEYIDEREEGCPPCPYAAEFRAWLRGTFGLEPAADPNTIVRAAEDELWDRFTAWIGPVCPDVVESREQS